MLGGTGGLSVEKLSGRSSQGILKVFGGYFGGYFNIVLFQGPLVEYLLG